MNCPKCGHSDYYTSLFGGGSCMNPTCEDASSVVKATREKVESAKQEANSFLKGEAVHRQMAAQHIGIACNNVQESDDDCPECGANPGECHFSCGQYEAPEDLESLVEDFGIEIEVKYGAHNPCLWDDGGLRHSYRVTLSREEEGSTFSLSTDFFTGTGAGEPRATDVLYCLVSDTVSVRNSSSFEEWAEDLGFDTDSRKAEASYNACVAQADDVEAFLGGYFDLFAEAEH